MRLIRSLMPFAFGLFVVLATPMAVLADRPVNSAAARYIRTLFDATLREHGSWPDRCRDIQGFGRFAAGRLWHALSEPERDHYNRDFCTLASDAVNRLRDAFPGLTLEIKGDRSAPQNMVSVQSSVARPGLEPWPVDWLVDGQPGQPELADLRILGISLGIFLRALAILEWPEKVPERLTSGQILRPWRQALDRALPPPGVVPPR